MIDRRFFSHVFFMLALVAAWHVIMMETTNTNTVVAQEMVVQEVNVPALWQEKNEAPGLSFMKTCLPDVYLIVVPDRQKEREKKIKEKMKEAQFEYCTSIAAALETFRNIRKEKPETQIIVKFSEEFTKSQPLTEPIILTKEFSGTAEKPTIFGGINRDRYSGGPVFYGAVSLAGNKATWMKWTEAKNAENFKGRFDSALEARIRPDVANSIWVCDLKPLGIKDYGDAVELGKRPELFAKGIRQQLARGPNEGFITGGKALGETKLSTGWAGGGTQEGIFEFVGDTAQLERWSNEPDLRLHGYWFWDWAEDYGKVESIDTAKKTITMQKPYHGYGYHDELRYYAANALCELDTAGEWYLDRATETLFWIPQKGIVDTTNFDGVTLSCFDAPFMLEIHDASHVIVTNLGFQEGRDSAIKIENSNDCILSLVTIKNMGRNGIEVNGGQHVGVSHCDLLSLGAGGMVISGGDRKTLTPGNHFVQDCTVKGFSRLKPTYTPAVLLSGCGHRIANNHFSDSGSSAMRLEGNDFMIEYNVIENVVNESDDQGGIDTWYNPSYRGITIRYNIWKDITGGTKCGAAGIRLDDMISGYTIYGNIFENCGAALFGAVQIHGGKDNIISNNVMLNCFYAVSFSPWGQKRYLEGLDEEFVKNRLYYEVNIDSDIYRQKYPDLAKIRGNADVNTVTHNLIVNGKNESPWRSDKGIQNMEGNVVLKINDATREKICTPEFLEKHGLQPIPVDKIGSTRLQPDQKTTILQSNDEMILTPKDAQEALLGLKSVVQFENMKTEIEKIEHIDVSSFSESYIRLGIFGCDLEKKTFLGWTEPFPYYTQINGVFEKDETGNWKAVIIQEMHGHLSPM